MQLAVLQLLFPWWRLNIHTSSWKWYEEGLHAYLLSSSDYERHGLRSTDMALKSVHRPFRSHVASHVNSRILVTSRNNCFESRRSWANGDRRQNAKLETPSRFFVAHRFRQRLFWNTFLVSTLSLLLQ